MNPTFSREDALATLGGIAQLSAFALAMEQHHKALFAHVPESVWNTHFKSFPAWFDLYFEPPANCLDRLTDLASRAEGLWPDTPDASPLDTFNTLLVRSRAMTREVATLRRDVETAGQPLTIELDPAEAPETLDILATLKASCAETRARCHYGQGMHALIAAGQRGKDEGYLRAVAIDPVLQYHPSLVERIAHEAAANRDAFARKLQKAAAQGPSKHIDKELHQLRFVLGLLHELKVLPRLKDAERYQLFCHDLGLYPDTGENPKAALCTFIKRWEASLL
jgi:hypothetical protein